MLIVIEDEDYCSGKYVAGSKVIRSVRINNMETRTVLVYRSGSNVGDHNHGDMEARIVSDRLPARTSSQFASPNLPVIHHSATTHTHTCLIVTIM